MQVRRKVEAEGSDGTVLGGIILRHKQPRAVAPHVSDIVKDMVGRLGYVGKGYGDDDSPTTRFGVGFMWEEALGRGLEGEAVEQGEVEVDGIVGTPDRVWLTDDGPVVQEFKATWMSCGTAITDNKFWMWWAQIKAYCWMWQTQRAELYALFVNGDYRPSSPQVRVYEAEFEEEELERHWAVLMEHHRLMMREQGRYWLNENADLFGPQPDERPF